MHLQDNLHIRIHAIAIRDSTGKSHQKCIRYLFFNITILTFDGLTKISLSQRKSIHNDASVYNQYSQKYLWPGIGFQRKIREDRENENCLN